MFRHRNAFHAFSLLCFATVLYLPGSTAAWGQMPPTVRPATWATPVAPPVGNVQQRNLSGHPLNPILLSQAPQPRQEFVNEPVMPLPNSAVPLVYPPSVRMQPNPFADASPNFATPVVKRPAIQRPPIQQRQPQPTVRTVNYYAPQSSSIPQKEGVFGRLIRPFRSQQQSPLVQSSYTAPAAEPRTTQLIDLANYEPPVKTVSHQVYQPDHYYQDVAPTRCATGSCTESCCQITDEPEWWVSSEALIWWSQSSDLPALATTNPNGNPVLGAAGTSVLFGGSVFDEARPGFRIRAGKEFEGYGSLEVEFFKLASLYDDYFVATDGTQVVGRPFFNTQTGQQDAELVGLANTATGQFRASLESRLYGAAIHLVQIGVEESCEPCETDRYSARVKIGPRFLSLRESLFMEEFVSQFGLDSQNRLTENFDTDNTFLGGEIGFQIERQKKSFFYRGGFSLALGATHQELVVSGQTTRQQNSNAAVAFPGALLAQRTNSGKWQRNEFTFIPQSNFTIGWRTKSGWELSAGYNLLYWSDVLRVANQVDTSLNPDLLPPEVANFSGAGAPQVLLSDDSYLAHGLSFGIEKRW